MSMETNSEGTAGSICSQASADGTSLSGSQDGPTMHRCGPGVALANHSHRQGGNVVQMTLDTCGITCSGSSESAALSGSLASRLRTRFGMGGWMEFVQTWRQLVTPSGRVYWAHTASPRRTGGNGCGGWPTPSAEAFEPADVERLRGRRERCKEQSRNGNGFGLSLGQAVAMNVVAWRTVLERDYRGAGGMPSHWGIRGLNEQVVSGALRGCIARMGASAALNPQFCRWLMGYPSAWHRCAPGSAMWQEMQDALSLEHASTASAQSEGTGTQ